MRGEQGAGVWQEGVLPMVGGEHREDSGSGVPGRGGGPSSALTVL